MVNYEPTARIYRNNSDAAARRVHEMIDDGIRAGALRDVNGTFAAQVVALTLDAVQSGALLRSTGLFAGDAFSELGDLLLEGLNRPAGSQVPAPATRCVRLHTVSPYRCSRHGCVPAARRR